MKYFMKYLFEHGFIVLDDALFDMAFIFYYYLFIIILLYLLFIIFIIFCF